MTISIPRPVNVALVQIRPSGADVVANNDHMVDMIRRAVLEGKKDNKPVDLAVLPEMWNSIIGVSYFDAAAEPVPEAGTSPGSWPVNAYTCRRMSDIAKETKIWLIGGSIPERNGARLYNCSTVYNPDGELVCVYRKLHLFDLSLPEMTYRESDQFAAGNTFGAFETPFGKFGLGLCYDMRFPELCTIAARRGCMAMFYPAAFTTHTGPLHWELLQRARALDNQIFVATCSPSRDETAPFVVYGHSLAASPMGNVIADQGDEEGILHVVFDPAAIESTKIGIPISFQRRFDMYPDVASEAVIRKTLA